MVLKLSEIQQILFEFEYSTPTRHVREGYELPKFPLVFIIIIKNCTINFNF